MYRLLYRKQVIHHRHDSIAQTRIGWRSKALPMKCKQLFSSKHFACFCPIKYFFSYNRHLNVTPNVFRARSDNSRIRDVCLKLMQNERFEIEKQFILFILVGYSSIELFPTHEHTSNVARER